MLSSGGGAVNGRWQTTFRPAGAIERDRLILLTLLAVVTAAAWVFTSYQATTMDMPMEVVAHGAAGISDGMDGTGTMAATGMAGQASGWSWARLTASCWPGR